MRGGRNEWLRSVCIGCSKFASPVYFALTCAWYTRRSVDAERALHEVDDRGMHAQTA